MHITRLQKTIVYALLYGVTSSIVLSVFLLTPHQGREFPILRGIIVMFSTILLTKYFVYMFVSPWHDVIIAFRERRSGVYLKHYEPLVSVIIPEWNESVGIVNTMESVLRNTYPRLEVVVINDGSTDDSDALIRNFMEEYEENQAVNRPDVTISYAYQPNGGKGSALNRAIELARGDIIVTIDADCVVMPDTIGSFVRHFRNREVMAAVGNVKIGNTQRLLGVIQQLEFLFSFYFKKADSLMGTIYIIGGAAGAFRKEIFRQVGYYKTRNITEDIDLSIRIQDAGMKIVYASDAVVYTEGASDLHGLMKQRLRWKQGRFQTFFENKHLFFSTNRKHNKLLTWIILPLAWIGELQLSLELGFLSFLYVYSYLISDFSSFISGIVIVASMFTVLFFFDSHRVKEPGFYFLAPIGWLLFYVSTFVEVTALVKSIWGVTHRQELKWQSWKREGVGR